MKSMGVSKGSYMQTLNYLDLHLHLMRLKALWDKEPHMGSMGNSTLFPVKRCEMEAPRGAPFTARLVPLSSPAQPPSLPY